MNQYNARIEKEKAQAQAQATDYTANDTSNTQNTPINHFHKYSNHNNINSRNEDEYKYNTLPEKTSQYHTRNNSSSNTNASKLNNAIKVESEGASSKYAKYDNYESRKGGPVIIISDSAKPINNNYTSNTTSYANSTKQITYNYNKHSRKKFYLLFL
jgi:hypothetical protein